MTTKGLDGLFEMADSVEQVVFRISGIKVKFALQIFLSHSLYGNRCRDISICNAKREFNSISIGYNTI